MPVLLIATARPELLDRRRGWSEGSAAFHVLILNPLPEEEAGLLVEAAMGESPVAPDLVQAVTTAAEGNPLFVEETIAMLLDTGALRREGERWVTSSPLTSLSIPPTLSLLIQSRIDGLPPPEQTVLSRASVIGKLFPLAALESLFDDPATLDGPIRALVDRGFLQPEGPPAGEYGFRHVLVRDTAYVRLPKMTRAELHERFADWLEAGAGRGESPDELVGAHLERALQLRRELGSVGEHLVDLATRAGRALDVASRRAMARGDPATADDLLTRLVVVASLPGLARREDGVRVIAEAGKLAVTLGRWQSAVELLSRHVEIRHSPILRDLGVALCKLHRAEPDGPEYRRGQRYLEEAAELAAEDADAYASLGGTWKGIDEGRAASLYGRAVRVDPSDPYALGNLLEYEVRERGDLSTVAERLEAIGSAVDRCRRQAAAGENIPWAFYDMGKFLLLLGKPRESLAAYAKAIHASTADWVLAGASASLHNLVSVRERLKGYEWVRRLLIAGRAARFGAGEAMDELALLTSGGSAIMAPVAMMAGGSTAAAEKQVHRYRETVQEGFSDFRGVVISGGTRHGIGALTGDLGQSLGDAIWTIGYVPVSNRDGVAADDDPTRYREIRVTEGDDFSPLEPLQGWIDVLASGVAPAQARVLGIDGGPIAALEFRTALALGAPVGIIRDSGREAGKIFRDPDWLTAANLVPLEPSPDAIRGFLT